MYRDLRHQYRWHRMKKDIFEYAARCLNCQQVKYEHQKLGGLLQKMVILGWKWQRITMDFVVGLSRTLRKFDAFWVIVDRLTKLAHFIPVPDEARLYGTDLVKDALEKVKLIQLYGTDLVKDALEKVLLKVSPIKGIMRFGKKGKLSTRFIDPFKVLRQVGEVSYELSMPSSLSGVHPVFHVSMIQRHHANGSHMLDYNTVKLDESFDYEEEPVAIIDRQVHHLRSKKIFAAKV
ncbi:uncharacterized protein [Nicotiana sylvestris]|uniref:uncharacterized protein n=1 Tax=Nicotiana sylvestris TaxID=4096 RepID=UPI00388C9E69